MKIVWKFIKGLFVAVYVILAIFVIVCLLNRNENGVIEIGNNNLVIVSDDDLEPNYNKGDLIVVKEIDKDDVEVNDMVFFYKMEFSEGSVNLANVVERYDVNEKETTFTVKGDYKFSSEYLIGRSSNSSTFPVIGSIIKLLISRWGFLFLIILPILLAFLYQIYAIVMEVKKELSED